jgi:hypothetical protein
MCNFRFRASTEEQNQAALQTYGILLSKDGGWTEDDLKATASPFATDAEKVQKRDLIFAPLTEGSEGVLARISELLRVDEGPVIEKTEELGEDEVEEEEEQDSEEQRQIKVHKLERVSSLLHQCWLVYPDSVADGIRTIADALRDRKSPRLSLCCTHVSRWLDFVIYLPLNFWSQIRFLWATRGGRFNSTHLDY